MADIYGTVGVWTGCGFSTVSILFPPPDILGYDACVTPEVQGTNEPVGVVEFQGPPAPVDEPIVILE